MKRNGKKSRKIKKLILACTLSAVVLIVSTYTWFIGIQTVKVNPFEINIATTEGLFLSMDGENWVYNLDVMDATAYSGNTNMMPSATNKLAPVSSIGELDSEVSRMKLYEKSSLTTSPGGYRLLSTRINNRYELKEDGSEDKSKPTQGSGYIVFDLFVKNLSGHEYYHLNNTLNEEAIYLTTDSKVVVDTAGGADQANTGIENSIRVGFAQIGRVEATVSNATTITGMNCTGTKMDGTGYTYAEGDVTGICREAQIWEPNDKDHEKNAINWFEKSCITRKTPEGDSANDVTKPESYNVAQLDKTPVVPATYCNFPGDTTAISTYAIGKEIGINDNVDIYDGHNGYSVSVNGGFLKNMNYFTDSEKDLKSTDRPQFMSLAPNSITKLRVYIWLEGQDLDNYDFAQLGKKVKINFGFTKERFTEDLNGDGKIDDKDYNGPAFVTSDNADITPPAVSE